MADNNKNPRRTIWLSETEPLSHYDIWLSKNQHLNSDGLPVLDSGVLRDCDYIFKVWDCDNWHPIVGLNSTALNKIDTVKNLEYNTEHNGDRIHSYSYKEFHLPLFTKPECSPAELFDAGTIGDAILEYVTEEEWENIFEGDTFNKVFKKYFKLIINEGDTNIINELLDPADYEYLGGVWADTFSLDDMFPDNATVHIGETELQLDIDDSYQWLAQAKYKYEHGEDDYNLYISAKDIIRIINKYKDDNPDAPGIQPSDDFEWRYAGHELVGGIWADEFQEDDMFPEEQDYHSQSDINNSYNWLALAKYRLGYNASRPEDYNLYISAKDIIKIITLYQEDNPDEPGITPGGGAIIDPEVIYRSFFNSPTVLKGWRDDPNSAWKPRFMLPGGNLPENRGKFLMLRLDDDATHDWWSNHTDDYDNTNTAVMWLSAHDIVTEGTGYTIDTTKKYLSCQDGTFDWETNVGTEYYSNYPININPQTNVISILPHQSDTSELYLCSKNNSVSWQPVDTGETYEVLGEHSSANEYYVIRGGSDDKHYLNGNGEWAEPPGVDYQNGSGITISNRIIEVTGASAASEGQVLTSDGDGNVTWESLPNFDTYSAGEGISIDGTGNNDEKEISIVSPKGDGTTGHPYELGGIKAQDISDVYRGNTNIVLSQVMIPVYRKPDTIEGTDNPEKGFLCVDKRRIGPEIIEYDLSGGTTLGIASSNASSNDKLITYNMYLIPSSALALIPLSSITIHDMDIDGESVIFANCEADAKIIFDYNMFFVSSTLATGANVDVSGQKPVFEYTKGGWILITIRKNSIKIEEQTLIQQVGL